MSAPQVDDVRALFQQKVQQPRPELTVVEPAESVRRDRVLVGLPRRLQRGPLQADRGPTQLQVGVLTVVEIVRQPSGGADPASQLLATVEHPGVVAAGDDGQPAGEAGQVEAVSGRFRCGVEQHLRLLQLREQRVGAVTEVDQRPLDRSVGGAGGPRDDPYLETSVPQCLQQ